MSSKRSGNKLKEGYRFCESAGVSISRAWVLSWIKLKTTDGGLCVRGDFQV